MQNPLRSMYLRLTLEQLSLRGLEEEKQPAKEIKKCIQ